MSAVDGGTPRETRRRHLGAVLRQVHLSGPVSRAALANRLGSNRSTILALTTRLAAAGLVAEQASGATGRAGRPFLVVRPEGRPLVRPGLRRGDGPDGRRPVGLGGTVLERHEAARRRSWDADLDEVVDVLAGFGRALVDAAPGSARCVGIGASYCGLVRAADGRVRPAPIWVGPTWTSRPRSAGEPGHMIINRYDGRPCTCGARGCLEGAGGRGGPAEAGGTRRRSGRPGRERAPLWTPAR
ncbi:ROK family transcriptional regulator [Actinomadura gamaensis]|uniref:ROK family protein n=1 Tax=Actinomadura gamaensis TaxID=1763541 RepID=A0ABV9U0C4_9ACTN